MTVEEARCDGCGGWLPRNWYELTGVVSGPAGELPTPTELEDPPVYCDEACCLRDLADRGFVIGEASLGVVERCERCGGALETERYELWAFHPVTKEHIPDMLPIAEPRAFCSEHCAREALADRGLEVRSLSEIFSSRSRTLRARLGRLLVGLRLRRLES